MTQSGVPGMSSSSKKGRQMGLTVSARNREKNSILGLFFFLFCFLYFVLLQVGGFAGLSVTRLANS